MKKPGPDDDDYVRPIYRTSFGEYAIVAVAACCTLAFILMMILPSPFAKYEKAKAKATLELVKSNRFRAGKSVSASPRRRGNNAARLE